ncbi:MAG: FAD-dependent thymidylate synthase [Desulfosporosinus sp.]|nr:FAD-dependent thymidylate synthase [Desulfosporosinus sp.]
MDTLVRSEAKFVRGHESPETIMTHLEMVGRICHASEGKAGPGTADRFVRMLINLGHESILEHHAITVLVTCDRATSHQWVRHRLGSYAQMSQRYVDHRECRFVDPEFRSSADGKRYCVDDLLNKQNVPEDVVALYRNYYSACCVARDYYQKLRDLKAAPEDARAVLPNGAVTKFYCTFNIRQWRHFFLERCHPAAQHSIRRIATELLMNFVKILPACFEDIVIKLQNLK